MLQLPAAAHDTAVTWAPGPSASAPWLRAAVPGTSSALPQMPCTWVTTNACSRRDLSLYTPPALQLPGDAHDTELTELPSRPRAPAGIALALPQAPCTSLTTNACSAPESPLRYPPALQLPAEAHDTELTVAPPAQFRAAVPGIALALPQ